jgi:2-keto-4-pentenoate hydratase/2-oxohepta-3-ene-1,7-dioic acid hydratase in catechol pathway
MRWVTYESPDKNGKIDRVGLVVEDVVYGLEKGISLVDLLGDDGSRLGEAGERARSQPAEVNELADLRLRPPIPRPPSIRDFFAFEEHMRNGLQALGMEIRPEWYEMPVFYFQNPNSLVGSGTEIRAAGSSSKVDFELEVAAVVGRPGTDLDPAEAEQHIAGYCIYNDWSARDLQSQETTAAPIGPAKGKDFANSLGPWLITPDELEPYKKNRSYNLAMSASVNGKQYSQGCLADIYWSFGEMLAYASRGAQLVPGDIIGSGTCGSGCILELSLLHGGEKYPWLAEGDEVVLEVEQLGRLVNRVAFGSASKPLREKSQASEREEDTTVV